MIKSCSDAGKSPTSTIFPDTFFCRRRPVPEKRCKKTKSSDSYGQHRIRIFSCLLFVLFEKTNPDIFVWSLSMCYTMAGLRIYCPKILCIQKIAEIKNITNTHKNFLLNCKSWQVFCLNFTSKCFFPMKSMLIDALQNSLFGK